MALVIDTHTFVFSLMSHTIQNSALFLSLKNYSAPKHARTVLLVIISFFAVCSVGFDILAEDCTYIIIDGIPVRMKNTYVLETNLQELLEFHDDVLPSEFTAKIHPSLTNGDDVVTAHVYYPRIVLLLAGKDCRYVRIVEWNDFIGDYSYTQSQPLPVETYLDTFHCADAVMIETGFIYDSKQEVLDLDDLAWVDMLIIKRKDGSWHLDSFNNEHDVVALCEGDDMFCFNDYSFPSDAYTWRVKICDRFETVNVYELYSLIEHYNTIFTDRMAE